MALGGLIIWIVKITLKVHSELEGKVTKEKLEAVQEQWAKDKEEIIQKLNAKAYANDVSLLGGKIAAMETSMAVQIERFGTVTTSLTEIKKQLDELLSKKRR